ncbi:MAG: FAD:protein FMN transferase [Planctomycetia bacterium]|nr:FAD:protein FMN transferase [Planctomycetia bacterium]
MKRLVGRTFLGLVFVGMVFETFSVAFSATLERYTLEGVEMAVPVKIILYAESEEQARRASEAAFWRFRDLNQRLSDYQAESEIRQLGDFSLPGQFTRVSRDLWVVLRESVRFAELTEGAFDPTVGQVVRLWRHARKSKKLPPPEKIAETLQTVGYENILFRESDRAVGFTENGYEKRVRIDLGGIAKGYAIDEALRVMRLHGVTRALVDAGGDVGLGDPPPGEPGWKLAVVSMEKEGEPTHFRVLSNCGVANSGDLYQFVEIDGQRYSHIVDPQTGLGLTNRRMVSVIAPDAMSADALASALSVMDVKKGLALVERLSGVEVEISQWKGDNKGEEMSPP